MRKLPLYLLVGLMVLGLFTTNASAVTRKQRNKIDRFKHYTTCHTCPRSVVVDYGPDGKLNHRYWEAAATNAYGDYLFNLWESGRIYYRSGKCTSKPQWNDGSHVYDQWWNQWHETAPKDVVNGSGPGYRYRRVVRHYGVTIYHNWGFHKDKYVGMTLRCNGTWAPAG